MKILQKNLLWLLLLFATSSTFATTRYVKYNATGANNGTSWADAYKKLQDAINAAASGDTLWVAKGTYKPTEYPTASGINTTNNRDKAFYLKKNLKIYGGFSGDELLFSQRNPAVNVTTLSGDLNSDDVISGSGKTLQIKKTSDNVYHVVLMARVSNSTVLDGFTIKGGNADGSSSSIIFNNEYFYRNSGGGVYILSNVSSKPRLTNLIFKGNYATFDAAITGYSYYGGNASPTISDCVFYYNKKNNNSTGGILGSLTSPIITNSLFEKNYGSAAFNNNGSSPKLINCIFRNNYALNGGALNIQNNAGLTVTNCSFYKNEADVGSSVFAANGTITNATFINCTFANNIRKGQSTSLYHTNASPFYKNCIFWNNNNGKEIKNLNGQPTFYYSIVKGSGGSNSWNSTYGINGGGNLDINPLFYNLSGNDFHLGSNSPAINAGNNAFNTLTTDLDDSLRIQDSIIDMGVYEYIPTVVVPLIAPNTDAETEYNNLSFETATPAVKKLLFDGEQSTQPTVAPNPINDNPLLTLSQASTVRLIRADGTVLRSFELTEGMHYLDCGDLQRGVYFLRFDNPAFKTIKLVK